MFEQTRRLLFAGPFRRQRDRRTSRATRGSPRSRRRSCGCSCLRQDHPIRREISGIHAHRDRVVGWVEFSVRLDGHAAGAKRVRYDLGLPGNGRPTHTSASSTTVATRAPSACLEADRLLDRCLVDAKSSASALVESPARTARRWCRSRRLPSRARARPNRRAGSITIEARAALIVARVTGNSHARCHARHDRCGAGSAPRPGEAEPAYSKR